jgi:hypothetical protein
MNPPSFTPSQQRRLQAGCLQRAQVQPAEQLARSSMRLTCTADYAPRGTRLLRTPGAVSFLAYRTVDGASPNTITVLEFRTLEDSRRAANSVHLKTIVQEIRSTGVDHPVERSAVHA